jgi:hypothetical protein
MDGSQRRRDRGPIVVRKAQSFSVGGTHAAFSYFENTSEGSHDVWECCVLCYVRKPRLQRKGYRGAQV